MKRVPQDQAHFGSEWITGLTCVVRGEYRNKEWNDITWPFVWCPSEHKWYVARRRLAVETLGIAQESLKERLDRDPIVSQGVRSLLIPSVGGAQSTACFPFDALPYVLQGIELNAPGLNPEIKPHLTYLKGLTHDILRDVLIYGKMPEVLREHQASGDDAIVRFDTRLQNIERVQMEQSAILMGLQRLANDTWLEAVGTRLDLSDMQGTLAGIKDDTGVMRAGYPGVMIQQAPAEVREKPVFLAVNGTYYVLIDSQTSDPAGLGRRRISAGEVSYIEGFDLRAVGKRILGESRYNGAKHGGPWVICMTAFTDDRKAAQENVHALIERAGGEIEPGRRDVYWVLPSVIDECSQFPPYLAAGEIFLFAQQHGFFATPMEVVV